MKKIKLNPIGFTIVDDEDYKFLNQWKWQLQPNGYVVRGTHIGSKKDGTRKHINIYMHRLLMKTPEGMCTDHINMNKLDNRKPNLRICTYRQSALNRGRHKDNISGYKGVNYHNTKWRRKKWRAEIKYKDKCINLGYRKTSKEAAYLYDQVAMQLFGEFAKTNIL